MPFKKNVFILLTLFIATATGCAPHISYKINTLIRPDMTCSRQTVISGKPHNNFKNQRVQLRDYLRFADAELYDNFALTRDKALLSGKFPNPNAIPSDFIKMTPHTKRLAMNKVVCRNIDLGLFEVIEYEERVNDIVERKEGERLFADLTTIALDSVLKVLHDRFDQQYDISKFDSYLRTEMPPILMRLYQSLWEARRARRAGLSSVKENDEWRDRVAVEVEKLGITLPQPDDPDFRKKSRDTIVKFIGDKLGELTSPKAEGVPPLSAKTIEDKKAREELLLSLQQALQNRYGSTEKYLAVLEKPLPKIFGAFLIREFSVMPANPEFDFHVTLKLPGHLVQTNGFRDLNGEIIWSFTDAEATLSGYSMWARSIIIKHDRIARLGIKNYPHDIADVEIFYRLLHKGGQETTDMLLDKLEACVEKSSLDPLKEFIESSGGNKATNGNSSVAVESARKMLEIFTKTDEPKPTKNKSPELEID